jgi:hypothetical protein
LGRHLLDVSRKLADIFFETTASVIDRPDGIERLRSWVEVALELYREHGWRGEFLAQMFLSAAPDAITGLHPAAYRLWAGLGASLYSSVKQRDVLGALPEGLELWSDAERELFLRTALGVASVATGRAHGFYWKLPPAIARLEPAEREGLLRVLARAGKHLAGVVQEIVPVAGALVRQIPAAHRTEALRLAELVASRFPEAAAVVLRSLPRVCDDVPAARVVHWFETGLDLAADNEQTALAYFALESRTSLRILYRGSTAVELEEEQGFLRKYIQMLSGDPVSVRGLDRFRLLLPLEEFPEENEVGLPSRMDLFGTHEDNCRLYRFAASQLAGRREFDTYSFLPPSRSGENEESPGGALVRYLTDPEQPELLEPLFLLTEGFRIQCRLATAYRGLAGEGPWVGTRVLERWANEKPAGQGRIMDALFAFLLGATQREKRPAWLPRGAAELVVRCAAPLAVPDATVQDSMRVAHELAAALGNADVESAIQNVRKLYTLPDDPSVDARMLMGDTGDRGQARPGDEVPVLRVADSSGEDVDVGDEMRLELDKPARDEGHGVRHIGVDELRRLLESGVRLEIEQATGSDLDGVGLYVSDLLGKVSPEQLQELRRVIGESDVTPRLRTRRGLEDSVDGEFFYYDEWDYLIGDYRARWCRLHEVSLSGDSGQFFNRTLEDYANLIPKVRGQFQRIRPELYRRIRRLEDGEDFDLNAVVEARVDLRARRTPSGKLYMARQREERDVASLFLIDMSASTDEPLNCKVDSDGADSAAVSPARHGLVASYRRIVDVTKEALVVMSAALEEIGDAFAIFGFSGHGRHNVEFYRVKSFAEPLNGSVKGRIGEIQPKRSTRMGAALRHGIEKMAAVSARCKYLFLLSDGFPQDHDYGQDRRSNTYGIRDTAVALGETESAGITPFCITVDKAGHDYLRHMCDESRYMVIDDVAALPQELPKIYQRVVRL